MARRLLGITAVVITLPVAVLTAPIWILVSLAADSVSRRWRFPTLRLTTFGVVYLAHQVVAIVVSIGLWLVGRLTRRPPMNAYRAMQRWWATSLLDWAGRLLGVRFDFGDFSEFPEGRFVLASRHASMVDAVLPIVLVLGRLERHAHYVLKDELLWDPAINIYGKRLGNRFVARGTRTDDDVAGIAALAQRAEPESALVIFPEGTYATPDNRRRVVASLERKATAGELDVDVVDYARKLNNVLPPKPAGTLTLLEHRPDADLVIVGHAGLEGVAELKGLRRRLPLDRPVVVRWWAHRRVDLPDDPEALENWLRDRWVDLDHWVGEVLY